MRHDKDNPLSRSTRRTVLKSTGVLAGGLIAQAARGDCAKEALALLGGEPTVTVSARKGAEASRWPTGGCRRGSG